MSEKEREFEGYAITLIENAEYIKYDIVNGGLFFDKKDEEPPFTLTDVVRYLKGVYTNRERFIKRFFEDIITQKVLRSEFEDVLNFLIPYQLRENGVEMLKNEMLEIYDKVTPFSYSEAFSIKHDQFRALVFQSVNIAEMMENLDAKKYKVDGKTIPQTYYNTDGTVDRVEENDNIYEVYEMSGKKLTGTDEKLYAVKCWCTSTNKEHYIWITEEYKDDPLSAIAATFQLPEDVIPNIKALKRQGDILLAEMIDPDFVPSKDAQVRPLTKDEYFGLLVAQS